MSFVRILLADDHQDPLDKVKQLLDPKYEIVGTVSDGQSLVTACEQLKPSLNHPPFANPDTNFTSPTFGVISITAVNSRVG